MACGELKQGINISDPLVILGALYYISEKRPEWTGMDGKTLLATSFGIASADFVREKAKEFLGGVGGGLSDEIAQGIAGALMVRFGKDKLGGAVEYIGRGVLLDLAAKCMKDMGLTLENLIGGVISKVTESDNVYQGNQGNFANVPVIRTLEDYVMAKYGVRP